MCLRADPRRRSCYTERVAQQSGSGHRPPRVLFWGTYDLSKPRNRILIAGLRENGAQVDECHTPIWEEVPDKGTLDPWSVVRHALRLALAYPNLVARFMRGPAPDVVLVGYLGQLDVLVLYPFARLRGVRVVWDQFISVYEAVVEDRGQLSRRHPLARALYAGEWLACRAARVVLMDTREHAAYVERTFGLSRDRVRSVWVGAEVSAFPPQPAREGRRPGLTALFYGQFIPLHGVDVIVRAAQLLEQAPIRFVLIGTGQESERISALLQERRLPNLEWHRWVKYPELIGHISAADVCLGIFGVTGKAARVIPNKVFQILAARRPLITRDSPAIRELVGGGAPGVRLIPPGDPQALADVLLAMSRDREPTPVGRDDGIESLISPKAIGGQLLELLDRTRNISAR